MSPTFQLVCGAECGIISGGTAPVSMSRHWDTTSVTGIAASSISTTIVRPVSGGGGLRSFNFIASGGNRWQSNARALNSVATHSVVRFGIYYETLPTATITSSQMTLTTAQNFCNFGYNSTNGRFFVRISGNSGATGSVVVNAGQWYLIDIKADCSVSPWRMDWSIDNVAQLAASGTVAANTFTGIRIGCGTGGGELISGSVYIDDLALSTSSFDYPIGEGRVLRYSPAADGTHTFTSGNFRYNNALAPSLIPANTDVWTYLRDIPMMVTTSFISQNAIANEYIENTFTQSTEAVSPRGVEVVWTGHGSSATTNQTSLKLVDGGTEVFIHESGSMAGTGTPSMIASRHYFAPPGGGSWTVAKLNGLKTRWGYATNLGSTPFFDDIMFEVEFPTGSTVITFPFYLLPLNDGSPINARIYPNFDGGAGAYIKIV